MKIIKKYGWTLYCGTVEAWVGMDIKCFRGNTYTLEGGEPPHKPSSEGKVWVCSSLYGDRELYPSVFNLKWIKDSENPEDFEDLQFVIWDVELYANDKDGDPLTNPDGSVRIFKPKWGIDMSEYVFSSDEVIEQGESS